MNSPRGRSSVTRRYCGRYAMASRPAGEGTKDRATRVDASASAAETDSQTPGIAGLPVSWIRYVHTAGVIPPNTAVAKLKAIENPDVFTLGGIISVRMAFC